MRVAPRRDEQQGAPAGAVQLLLVDLHRLAGEVGEHRQRVAELPGVGARQQFVQGVHGYSPR